MKRIVYLCVAAFFLTFSADAGAEAIVDEGVQELGLSGNLDFEGPSGGVDIDFSASYGHFMSPSLEVGGFVSLKRELDGNFKSYGIGVFAEQHMRYSPDLLPYAGLGVGVQYSDVDFEDDEWALTFIPKVGLKWFLRDNIAIDTNLFLALATDKIYVNDRDTDRYDFGLNLGLRVYFR